MGGLGLGAAEWGREGWRLDKRRYVRRGREGRRGLEEEDVRPRANLSSEWGGRLPPARDENGDGLDGRVIQRV